MLFTQFQQYGFQYYSGKTDPPSVNFFQTTHFEFDLI